MDNPIITHTNAICAFRTGKFLNAGGKRIAGQTFHHGNYSFHDINRQLTQILLVDFFHSTRRAMLFEALFKFGVGNSAFVTPLGNHGEIIKIFE